MEDSGIDSGDKLNSIFNSIESSGVSFSLKYHEKQNM